MDNFSVFVYDLGDLKGSKKLIDEFVVQADSKSVAADIAHQLVDEKIDGRIGCYSDASLGRLEVNIRV